MKNLLIIFVTLFIVCVTLPALAQTPAPEQTSTGMKLNDPTRGFEFTAPSSIWGINAGQTSISLNHESYYDAIVTLKKSWFTVATVQEAYNKRKESLQSYLPGAVFIKENDAITLSNNTPGISMIYKNPSDLKVKREIMFIHKGQPYELVFQAKEENFQTVKEDFGYILTNLKLF